MATDIEPPELARLLDAAERPRVDNWSLRAALTRYAQPQPQRASDVIELLRRIESALRPHQAELERDGTAAWAAVGDPGDDRLVGHLLRALADLDRLGDELASWAVRGGHGRPDDAVDAVVGDLTERLGALGVEREERIPPPGARRRG